MSDRAASFPVFALLLTGAGRAAGPDTVSIGQDERCGGSGTKGAS
jgi:hypothetical protein